MRLNSLKLQLFHIFWYFWFLNRDAIAKFLGGGERYLQPINRRISFIINFLSSFFFLIASPVYVIVILLGRKM